jgi:hypothetical protein
VLLRLAETWRWEPESERTLWAILRLSPVQSWAHTALVERYRQRGDGAKMLEVIAFLRTAFPGASTYDHDWALLTLLTAPNATWDAPKEALRVLALAEPGHYAYATSYAFALAQVGKYKEARAVVEKIAPEARALPTRAVYFAYVYGMSGRHEDHAHYAALAARVPLLKEERLLLATAAITLERRFPVAPATQAEPVL